ncbi:MAG TPA: response regulator transcription factor [Acidimicrobiales bacterium]|nr:response regulator transcription factor [Acidimicrobiales bacterium]
MAIRVVVVDDHADMRAMLSAILTKRAGFTVVGDAENGMEGVAVTVEERPDVVLLDLSMPDMDGLTALGEIRRLAPDSKVIVLSAFGTERAVTVALESGAAGFVHKGSDLLTALPAAIREVLVV